MRCQRQILDICWWAYVSNAELLQRSGYKGNGQLEKTAGSPSQSLAQQGSGGRQCSTPIYAVDIRDRQESRSGATVHSEYATTTTMMMMMKDDVSKNGG